MSFYFRLVPKSAIILRYFTELAYDVVVKQLHRFQNLLLIVSDHIKIK